MEKSQKNQFTRSNRDLPKGLYPIVDNTATPFLTHLQIATQIIEGGAKILQLRAKNLSSKEFLQIALDLREITLKRSVLLIINDRVDIAMLACADGVHLGQDDLPCYAAREILGKDKIIGLSTHNLDEALAALNLEVDYIGFGPIFPTSTKKDIAAVQGIKQLHEICTKVQIPVVAIGGIDLSNIEQVFSGKAHCAAVISALTTADNIQSATEKMIEKIENDL